MKLFLIRHGESLDGVDPPLSDRGKIQAEKLGKAMNKLQISKVYISTSKRAIETAQPFLKSNPTIPVETSDDLNEIYRVIVGGTPKENTPQSREPEDRKRLASFFRQLDSFTGNENIAIIFHGNFIRYILGSITRADLTKLWTNMPIDCGSISIVEKQGSTFSVQLINGTDHLNEHISSNRQEWD